MELIRKSCLVGNNIFLIGSVNKRRFLSSFFSFTWLCVCLRGMKVKGKGNRTIGALVE